MRKLLIIDDERVIREGIARSLDWKSLGIGTVRTASNGEKAFAIIRKEKTDLVISDIVMPEMDGLSLIEQCRKQGLPTQFIILSSYDDFSYAQKAIQNEVCEYILKPCDPEELKKGVIRVLRKLDMQDSKKQALCEMENILPDAKSQSIHELLHGGGCLKNIKKLWGLTSELYVLLVYPLNPGGTPPDPADPVLREAETKFSQMVCALEDQNLVLITGDTSADRIAAVMNDIRRIPERFVAAEARIFLSDPGGIDRIRQSYERVRALLPLAPFFDRSKPVYVDRFLCREAPDPDRVESIVAGFSQALLKKDAAAITDVLNRTFETFKREKYSFDAIRKICLRLFFCFMQQRGYEDMDDTGSVAFISYAEDVQSLYDILLQEINRTVILLESKASAKFSRPVQLTLQYANQHFGDSNLSLRRIASTVLFVNADYLGKRFKMECGMKFSGYLLSLRIEKAKWMLRKTNASIQQIAGEVGFENDGSYFSQIFKKYTGILPKEYRSLTLPSQAGGG